MAITYTISDNFSRANGTIAAGNSNWTQSGTAPFPNIVSNAVVGTVNAGSSAGLYTGASVPADNQTVSMTFVSVTGSNGVACLSARGTSTAGYTLCYAESNGLNMYFSANGTGGQLGTNVPFTMAAGNVLTMNVQGSPIATITGYVNGVQKIQQSDSSVPTGGSAGISFYNATAGLTINNFLAGTGTPDSGSGVQSVVTGTATLPTTAVSVGSCNSGTISVATGSLSNVLSTDTVKLSPTTDLSTVAGYAPSSSGALYITHAIAAGSITVKACNNGPNSLTPGASVVLNFAVQR